MGRFALDLLLARSLQFGGDLLLRGGPGLEGGAGVVGCAVQLDGAVGFVGFGADALSPRWDFWGMVFGV